MLWVILSLLYCVERHVHAEDVRLSRCGSGELFHVRENQSFSIWCYAPRSYQDPIITWQIKPWRGNQALELVCNNRYSQCTSHPDVELYGRYSASLLAISKVERAMFSPSTLTCNVTSSNDQGKFSSDSCLIDVTYSADIGACQLQVHKGNWTVSGSCDVTKVYSSAADYGCTIEQRYWKKGISRVIEQVTNMSSLASFTDTPSGHLYYRGQCQFTVPLPSFDGTRTYLVKANPGHSRKLVGQRVSVVPPSAPQLINCGQEFLAEGGNSSEPPCLCRVTSLGSPAGRLVWRSGDAVLLHGDYGVTQLMFPYDNLDRTHSGEAVNCHVDWVGTLKNKSFSANIAYGPDTAVIFVRSGNDSVTLLCTSLHVHPVSALFTVWGGLCQGQQGRRCTLTTPFHQRDGKNVTCTLTNQKVPGKQATVTWTLKLDSEKNQECACDSSDGRSVQDNLASCSLSEGLGIGVGVTLAVVLVVVVVLSVLLWRRRLLPACAVVETCSACFTCCSPTYASPSTRKQQEEAASHNYTDLSHYEPVEAVSQPHQQVNTDRRTTGANNHNSHIYINTAANIQV